MKTFTYQANSARVIFGWQSRTVVAEEVSRLGRSVPMLVCSAEQGADALALADDLGIDRGAVFAGAVVHTPIAVTEAAVGVARELRADVVIALGGGSTTGLAKAIAVRTGLDQVIMPTSYAGSEMTPLLGETVEGRKTVVRSLDVLPEVVIYDPELTLSMPAEMSVVSGLNAVAHAVEAFYGEGSNPIHDGMAREAVARFSRALPKIHQDPADREAREDALLGAWLAGACLSSVGMGLHHKICHVLGGMFNLPHAPMHAIVLPYALAYNAPAIPEAMEALAAAMGGREPVAALRALVTERTRSHALRDLGMPEEGIAGALEQIFAQPYANPQPLAKPAISDTLRRAWAGEPPAF